MNIGEKRGTLTTEANRVVLNAAVRALEAASR